MNNKPTTKMKLPKADLSRNEIDCDCNAPSRTIETSARIWPLCIIACMFLKPVLAGGCPSRFLNSRAQTQISFTEQAIEERKELLLQAAEEEFLLQAAEERTKFLVEAEDRIHFTLASSERLELHPNVEKWNLLEGLLANNEGVPCVPVKYIGEDGSIRCDKYLLKLVTPEYEKEEQKAQIFRNIKAENGIDVLVAKIHLNTLRQSIESAMPAIRNMGNNSSLRVVGSLSDDFLPLESRRWSIYEGIFGEYCESVQGLNEIHPYFVGMEYVRQVISDGTKNSMVIELEVDCLANGSKTMRVIRKDIEDLIIKILDLAPRGFVSKPISELEWVIKAPYGYHYESTDSLVNNVILVSLLIRFSECLEISCEDRKNIGKYWGFNNFIITEKKNGEYEVVVSFPVVPDADASVDSVAAAIRGSKFLLLFQHFLGINRD